MRDGNHQLATQGTELRRSGVGRADNIRILDAAIVLRAYNPVGVKVQTHYSDFPAIYFPDYIRVEHPF